MPQHEVIASISLLYMKDGSRIFSTQGMKLDEDGLLSLIHDLNQLESKYRRRYSD